MNKDLREIKKLIIKMAHEANVSHVGAALSVADILYVLYYRVSNITKENIKTNLRDKIILSKGHSSAALYSIMAHKGFITKESVSMYAKNGGTLPCHIDMTMADGLDVSTGSLGHGLGVGVGMALANKMDKNPARVYVIMGDGECNEGSVWEAVMFAGTHKLNNINAIVDFNNFQAFGKTNEVIYQRKIRERFEVFGFDAVDVDGHNFEEIEKALTKETERPKAIIAHTIKGKGVSYMENTLEWHYKSPNKEQYEQAIKEIEEKY